MSRVATEEAVVWRARTKFYIRAEIVLAYLAERTRSAWDTRFNSNTIT